MRTVGGRFASILVKKTFKAHRAHQGLIRISRLTIRQVNFADSELSRGSMLASCP